MSAFRRFLSAAVAVSAALLLPNAGLSQTTQICVTASNPYCEHCSCVYSKKGVGATCFISTGRYGPNGETCKICYTVGRCTNRDGGIGLSL